MGFFSSIIGGTIGKILGNSIDAHHQRDETRFNVEQQKKLAKYINSNKHQWEISDLRNAGLNPILSATNSSYASSSLPVGTVGTAIDAEVSANRKIDEVEKKQIDINNKIALADIANKNSSTALNDTRAEIEKIMTDKSVELQNAQIANAYKNGLLIDSQTAKNYQDILVGKALEQNYSAVTAKTLADKQARDLKTSEIIKGLERSDTVFDYIDDAIRRKVVNFGLTWW